MSARVAEVRGPSLRPPLTWRMSRRYSPSRGSRERAALASEACRLRCRLTRLPLAPRLLPPAPSLPARLPKARLSGLRAPVGAALARPA